jgi:hypothetical protein
MEDAIIKNKIATMLPVLDEKQTRLYLEFANQQKSL